MKLRPAVRGTHLDNVRPLAEAAVMDHEQRKFLTARAEDSAT